MVFSKRPRAYPGHYRRDKIDAFPVDESAADDDDDGGRGRRRRPAEVRAEHVRVHSVGDHRHEVLANLGPG